MTIQQIQTEIASLEPHCNGTHDCPNGVFCGSINFSACGRISLLKSAIIQEGRKLAQTKKAQELQEITFNEQTNSGDFNETPITDVNVNSGCSECTGEIRYDPIEVSSMPPSYQSQGYHKMPDGSLMKDSDMEKGNNMKFVGIAAIGLIGLMVLKK